MCDYRLPAWKIKQLKKFHKTLKQKYEAYRVNAVVLLGTGYTPRQVAEILLVSEGSVRNYWDDFKKYGKDELIKRDYTGRESFLTDEQEQESPRRDARQNYTQFHYELQVLRLQKSSFTKSRKRYRTHRRRHRSS